MTDTRLRVSAAVVLLLLLIVGGTLGYHLIENWSVTDSLYMTFITLTTVGFSEVAPLSEAGKHFTIVFLIVGVGTVGYSISTVIGFVFEGPVAASIRERRMNRTLRRMSGHYIVCGAGDIGREVVHEFQRTRTPCVVIERDPSHSELAEDSDAIVVQGDASEEAVLKHARIEEAKGLVAVLPSDADNVFVTLTARQMNASLQIIAKGTDEFAYTKLRRAGANRVITPAQIAGRRIASSILRPSVVNFLDVIVDDTEVSMRMEEYLVGESSPIVNKTIKEADLGQHTGAIVLAITNPAGRAKIDATRGIVSAVRIGAGDKIIALGSQKQLEELEAFISGKIVLKKRTAR